MSLNNSYDFLAGKFHSKLGINHHRDHQSFILPYVVHVRKVFVVTRLIVTLTLLFLIFIITRLIVTRLCSSGCSLSLDSSSRWSCSWSSVTSSSTSESVKPLNSSSPSSAQVLLPSLQRGGDSLERLSREGLCFVGVLLIQSFSKPVKLWVVYSVVFGYTLLLPPWPGNLYVRMRTKRL